MASFSIVENFKSRENPAFLEKARELEPVLQLDTHIPVRVAEPVTDLQGGLHLRELAEEEQTGFRKGDKVVFDFGEHLVGSVSFDVVPVGSHYDAPAYLRLKFAEMPFELAERSEDYNGWLSASWIQEETLHLDDMPVCVHPERRYAFRYMEIQVLDTSPKYGVKIENVVCESVTSAGEPPEALNSREPLLNSIDEASVRTLRECMQSVFEDGVKRDRRLWLGDLRLQALANYATFKNYSLVKRCLYLFAGSTFEDGRLGACLFHRPEPVVDDTYLIDFALLFVPTLWEYYENSGDTATLMELAPTALDQLDICNNTMLDENGVVVDQGDAFWCFLDWGQGLNKQAGAQATLIYATEYGVKICREMKFEERAKELEERISRLRDAARRAFWDGEKYVSGGQVSWASQIWMILAGVSTGDEAKALVKRMRDSGKTGIVTPYLFHYYVEALLKSGEDEAAMDELKRYWGGMLAEGADTFWEIYDPENPRQSPYGSAMVNSYCHAWSCTPAYLLRCVFKGKEKFKSLFEKSRTEQQ